MKFIISVVYKRLVFWGSNLFQNDFLLKVNTLLANDHQTVVYYCQLLQTMLIRFIINFAHNILYESMMLYVCMYVYI